MKRSLINRITLTISFIGNFIVWSQFDIHWGEQQRAAGFLKEIFPIQYGEFYAQRFQGNSLYGSDYLYRYSSFKAAQKARLKPVLDHNIGVGIQLIVLNQSPYYLIADKKEGKHLLYLSKLNSSGQAEQTPKLIFSISLPGERKRHGNFNIILNEDRSGLAVTYGVQGEEENKLKLHYALFDASFEKVQAGELELSAEGQKIETVVSYLSNQKELYVLCREMHRINEKRRWSDYVVNGLQVVKPNSSGNQHIRLPWDEKKEMKGMAGQINAEGRLAIQLFYGFSEGLGIHSFILNSDCSHIQTEFSYVLPDSLISGDWLPDWGGRRNKKAQRQLEYSEAQDYEFKNIYQLSDGSILGLMEQSFTRVVTNYNPGSNTYSTTTMFYRDDILAYRFSDDGRLLWMKTIPKKQVSTNDNASRSSFYPLMLKDSLYLFFNDHVRNYSTQGIFLSGDETRRTLSYQRKTIAGVCAALQISDGSHQRKVLFHPADALKITIIPQMFTYNRDKNELTIYHRNGRKERFGILQMP